MLEIFFVFAILALQWEKAISYQLSTINYQLSTYQPINLSTYQPINTRTRTQSIQSHEKKGE